MTEKNFSGKINLLALKGAVVQRLNSAAGQKKCLIIPIDDAHLFEGEKGIYFDFFAKTSDKFNDQTHFLKQTLSKSVYQSMSEEERNAIPIMGNMRVAQSSAMPSTSATYGAEADNYSFPDDLPM